MLLFTHGRLRLAMKTITEEVRRWFRLVHTPVIQRNNLYPMRKGNDIFMKTVKTAKKPIVRKMVKTSKPVKKVTVKVTAKAPVKKQVAKKTVKPAKKAVVAKKAVKKA